jgi:hypothetical protein
MRPTAVFIQTPVADQIVAGFCDKTSVPCTPFGLTAEYGLEGLVRIVALKHDAVQYFDHGIQ